MLFYVFCLFAALQIRYQFVFLPRCIVPKFLELCPVCRIPLKVNTKDKAADDASANQSHR